jgi:prepilin-type N-terminal cleavage/methylation domain-containing protein
MGVLTTKNKQGFTIIEVVLVLAIAALIFLMVFIALPALQRNQRDTARKTILGKVSSAVTSYQSNNRGKNPVTITDVNGYVDADATGIMENEYQIEFRALDADGVQAKKYNKNTEDGAGSDVDYQRVTIVVKAKCDANGTTAIAGNNRNAAVLVGLENGEASLCQNV